MIQPVGYFKVWRELFNKPIWLNSTPEQKTILMTVLGMANFRENEWEWSGNKFSIKPGQFITSLESIVKQSGKGITIQNVRTSLARFEKLEFLTNESTKTGRLITILNWELYQAHEENLTDQLTDSQQRPNKDLTNDQQRANKELTTKEEGNKAKKVKNDKESQEDNYTDNPKLIEAIKGFKEMRKLIKKPLTDKGLKGILNKLDTLSKDDDTKIRILENSIMNSWQGVFPLKEDKPKQKGDFTKRSELDHTYADRVEKGWLK